MTDPRVTRLAELMTKHSLGLTAADTVLLHVFDVPEEVTAEYVRVVRQSGANVLLRIEQSAVTRALMLGMTARNAEIIAENDLNEMKSATAYLALRGSHNVFEQTDVPSDIRQMWAATHGKRVHLEQRVPHTRWVVTRWPTPSMAMQAGMSTAAFEDFYFRVTTVDYGRMAEACKPLKDLMDRTDRVRLVGPGTDLSFSIKDIGSVPCCGEANIPDGECFSCPVKESVNGEVTYNTVSLYHGTEFSHIHFKVRDGHIYEASAGAQTDRLNQILDTDPGARYFGEWSLGFNPHVLHPMKDTLFDEKIAGSFHLTPGNAYPPPGGNGNESAVHWDIVCIHRPEYGGGEIWFDDVLIRKDGLFVMDALHGLNPDRLG